SEDGLKLIPAISPVPKDYTWKSSPFGRRKDPFTGLPAFHSGIDFAGRQGTPVYATADGFVVYSYEDGRLGNVVVLTHDPAETGADGRMVRTKTGIYRTEYGHLQRVLVRNGDWVKRGQQVGNMGSTGRSTGPHLHYAVRYQDRGRGPNRGYVDPETFLLDWPKDDRVTGWLAKAGDFPE
ncbi:MAG: M23 family metallopeptidase, partial [Gemmatimonadota bacterium]